MTVAEDRLDVGLKALSDQAAGWDHRQNNYEGDQELPFAPEGVNVEYQVLRRQSLANWLGLAMDGPVQRMSAESLRDRTSGEVDTDTWNEVWLANNLDSLQKICFNQMMVHGRGIWSVSKIPGQTGRAKVMVENTRRVFLHRDPENPFHHDYAVKTWTEGAKVSSSLILPAGVSAAIGATQVAVVYDATTCERFEKSGSAFALGGWRHVKTVEHGLEELPFVQSATNLDADGSPRSAIEQLIPMQNALNTIRFQTLLAMQFAAFRTLGVTGFDPVVKNEHGEIQWMKDKNGATLMGPNGQPMPILNAPGRAGVDRMLVFPGEKTEITALQESNLSNYVTVYSQFLSDLFALGQIPPQYALTKMANLSGDALAGAESTLQSLTADLKREAGSSIGRVMRLANKARGVEPKALTLDWADTEPKSFAQIIDGVVKLISVKFPREAAFEMMPGATPTKVKRWMEMSKLERESDFSAKMLDELTSDPALTDPAAV